MINAKGPDGNCKIETGNVVIVAMDVSKNLSKL